MLLFRISLQRLAIKLHSQDSLVFEDVVEILESMGVTWVAYETMSDAATADDSIIVFDTIDVYGDAVSVSEDFYTDLETAADYVTVSEDVQFAMQYAANRMINGHTINSQPVG